MKAFSIKQPWASLIAHGIKDIKNRTWRTHFRGKIYIHASAKQAGSYDKLLNDIQKNDFKVMYDSITLRKQHHFSAIIGEVEIIDCVINHPSVWAEPTATTPDGKEIVEKPIYNWVLANPVLYEKPILNVKGKLSFWKPDIDIKECTCCVQKLNSAEMQKDITGELFCTGCWEGLLPMMNE